MDPKVVSWIREFLLGSTQRIRVVGQLSEEVKYGEAEINQLMAYSVYVSLLGITWVPQRGA